MSTPTLAVQNVRTRLEWAGIISADWRRSIENIIQTGRDLIAARDQLSGSEFVKMIEEDLPFSISTARQLKRIAEHPAIAESGPGHFLPPSWTVLSQLSRLSAEDFDDAQERGLINADTSKRKATAIKAAYKTPIGGGVGEGISPTMLPSPKEANEVARATNRLVAASDGHFYSGSTDEEGDEYVRRREQTYGVIDAINTIDETGVSPKQWCKEVKRHWLNRFEFGRIEGAIYWLTELRAELIQQKLIYDCEDEADGE